MFDLKCEHVFDIVIHKSEHVFVSHPDRTVILDLPLGFPRHEWQGEADDEDEARGGAT